MIPILADNVLRLNSSNLFHAGRSHVCAIEDDGGSTPKSTLAPVLLGFVLIAKKQIWHKSYKASTGRMPEHFTSSEKLFFIRMGEI